MGKLLFFIIIGSVLKVSAGVVELPAAGIQRLVLKGWDAQVSVTSRPGSKNIRINGVEDDLTPGVFIVQKKGNNLEVSMVEWPSKTDWKDKVKKKTARKNIEISGHSLPIEIYLKEGQVFLNSWDKEAKVTLLQGKVFSKEGQGPLDLDVHNGEIEITSQTGKLKISQYQGEIDIKNLTGDLELSSFASQIHIEKAKGSLRLDTQKAPVKLVGGSGSLQLENGQGGVQVRNFQGRIDGTTQEGALNIQVLLDSEVQLKSASGRIQIDLPANSGAGLNLVSQEGDIYVPQGLKVRRSASEKSFRGRLRGSQQKASVLVRSEQGSIVIK